MTGSKGVNLHLFCTHSLSVGSAGFQMRFNVGGD